MRARRLLLPGLVAGVFLALAALPALRALLWRWEQNPILRGRLLAVSQGCLDCHRPGAGPAIPNPGSRWGSVPRFGGGNAFMYATTLDEIEQFIRFGAPRSWLDEPEVRARLEGQRLRMPAYGDSLSDREIDDLVAYVAAVEGVERPAAGPGRELAREHGCVSCHGVEGSGGLPNPGSLGGFIPGFLGRNFTDLVADRAEFGEWIRDGTSTRLAKNPLIRGFWRRQKLAMPAYHDSLDETQIDELWAWVEAMRAAS